MNAPLRNFDFAGSAPDRRREQRVGAPVKATLAVSGKAPCPAQVSDVSLYGCCVQTALECLRPGRLVAVTLEGGPAWESIVRWTGSGVPAWNGSAPSRRIGLPASAEPKRKGRLLAGTALSRVLVKAISPS